MTATKTNKKQQPKRPSNAKGYDNKTAPKLMKLISEEPTATETVLYFTANFPEMTAKEIAEETNIKLNTVYAVQSKVKQDERLNSLMQALVKKPKDADEVVKPAILDGAKPVSEPEAKAVPAAEGATVQVPEGVQATSLYDFVFHAYLDKIDKAETLDEAKKYHELLFDMMTREPVKNA